MRACCGVRIPEAAAAVLVAVSLAACGDDNNTNPPATPPAPAKAAVSPEPAPPRAPERPAPRTPRKPAPFAPDPVEFEEAEPLAEVSAWLERFRGFWEQRLDALATEIARGRRSSGS